ncbi:MAG: YjbH domain-containing protein [Armatimonadota bacterium]|nr:YjbH domain-containing protein [Armatimonadota bacterium]
MRLRFSSSPFAKGERTRYLLCAAAVVFAAAGGAPAAKNPSTQYVNVAPLPGAGAALNNRGEPDGWGAIQANIPVAYTPGANYCSFAAFRGNHIGEHSSALSNGTGLFGAGFGASPRVYFSAMMVSSLILRESKALSFQVQVCEEASSRPAIAFGVQDVLNKEESTGEARALYAVATKSYRIGERPLYLTLGYGSGRFLNRPFVGTSMPLNDRFNVFLEYDGFQLSEALAWRPEGRFGALTILAGYNNRSGPLVGANWTQRLPTGTQLLIGAALIAMRDR